MMTIGQHDALWMAGAKMLPKIERALRVANAIAIAKELYDLEELGKANYKATLLDLLETSEFTTKEISEEEA